MRAAVALMLCLIGGSGCAYRVTLASLPEPAEVDLPNRRGTVVTPTEVTLRYVPFGHQRVRVRAPGYRTLEFDLRRSEIRFGRYISDTVWRPATLFGGSRGTVRFVLVPEHGPVGTWEADEVP